MSLRVGSHFGPYEIRSLLGAGGMGEVYRARDSKLGRDVAIKVLPRAFAAEHDRLLRLEREARLLASVNHPNVGAIYGLEDAGGVRALVLELVEGPTLAERLADGPLRVETALHVARQIAEALEAAHGRGIIHRDLKPANIKVTEAGLVKVLDFGLAKASVDDGAGFDLAESATVTSVSTREGVILGTAAYMSPEQARGLRVDGQTDVWMFGCVLYEMLTGRRAFGGETVSDTIAAVLNGQPDWTQLPPTTPRAVRRLLKRCLQKDRRPRLHHIADARIEIEEAIAQPLEDATATRAGRPPSTAWTIAILAIVVTGIAGVAYYVRRPADARAGSIASGPMTRLTWDSGLTMQPGISADGRLIAYASDRSGEGNLDVWVQHTSGGAPIRLTNYPTDDHSPDVSPDGSLIAFRSEREGGGVYVIAALGGDARLIAPRGRGPRFSPDGRTIAFWMGGSLAARMVSASRRTFVIPAAGGEPEQLAGVLANAGDPVWAPDGKALLIFGRFATSGEDVAADWWWVPLDRTAPIKTGAYESMQAVGILTAPPAGLDFPFPQAWTDGGVLFTAVDGTADAQNAWALSIDQETGRAVGYPRRLTAGAGHVGSVAAARDGRVVFSELIVRSALLGLPIDANAGRSLGQPTRLRTDAARTSRASASENGRLITFGVHGFGGGEVRIKDLQTGRERLLVATPLASLNPVISPSGRSVAYTVPAVERGASEGPGPSYIVGADGGAPRKVCDGCVALGFAGESHLIIRQPVQPGARETWMVWLLDVDSHERAPLVETDDVRLAPGRRWMAFTKGDGIYLAPVRPGAPPPEREWIRIETVASSSDRPTGWSPDSRLLYLLLERDGFRCLYALRVNPETVQPQGSVFPVHHFHDARFRWGSTSFASAVVTGLFVFNQNEISGNTWMTVLGRPRG